MRAMQHNSRTNSKGRVHGQKHNDRNFDVGLASNIDTERMVMNVYWNWLEDPEVTFEQAELQYYDQTFAEQLKITNDNYIKNRHREKCKTMDEFIKTKKFCPEETVLQIGKMENHVDLETFKSCFMDYMVAMEEWNLEHGEPFQILDFAIHADETVSHAQVRRVWKYEDENGITRVGQEKALAAAGVELPKPDEKEGKRNHRKMVFDAMMRNKWLDICEEHGIDIEREPVPDARHNRDKEEMIRDKNEALINENKKLEKEKEKLQQQKQQLEQEKNDLKNENDNLRVMLENVQKQVSEKSDELSEKNLVLSSQDEKINVNNAKIDNQLKILESGVEALSATQKTLGEKAELLLEADDRLVELEMQIDAANELLEEKANYLGGLDDGLKRIKERSERNRLMKLFERFIKLPVIKPLWENFIANENVKTKTRSNNLSQ